MSRSQRIIRTAALTSVSYGVLVKMMGPLTMQQCDRIINQAIFYSYGARTAEG